MLATLFPLVLVVVSAKLTRPLPVTSAVTSNEVTVSTVTTPDLTEVEVIAGALL